MWISFSRLAICHQQEQFLLLAPGWFAVHSLLISFLSPAEGHRLLRSCIILVIDRNDLFLSATALRLQYSGYIFSVPTPPVQPFLVLGQVGETPTVWDLESSESQGTDSQTSSLSSFAVATQNHALEDERSDHLQDEGGAGDQ